MAVRTLYFDESGFTGYNLLDPEQPTFAIASTAVSEDSAKDILHSSFPRYRGVEFKFSRIWRSKNRAEFLNFSANLKHHSDEIFTYIIDKRFSVLVKVVDFLLELLFTNLGFDFYADGFCWKYANYIYFSLVEFANPALLDSLLRHYQSLSRDPTPETLINLQFMLNIMAESCEEPVKTLIEQMALGASSFEKFHDLKTFRGTNELQTTTMIAIITYWREKYKEDFSIIHDASSNFTRNSDMWNRITNSDVPPQIHRVGDGSDVHFPLRVISTAPVNSRDSSAIQLCDMLAGLTTTYFSPRTQGEDRAFINEIIEAGMSEINYNGIRPQSIFPDRVPPRQLNGPDIIDHMTEIIFGPHNN